MTFHQDNLISRRRFLAITGGASALFLLGGCATASGPSPAAGVDAATATTPQRGGSLRIIPPDTVTTLDASLNALGAAEVLLGMIIYDNLTRRSEGEEGAPLYPGLAESWSMSDDGLSWTFHLRQGVTFHHGAPFTAKDVEYSLNRLRDPSLGATLASSMTFITQVEVVDDFTVQIHTETPNVALPYFLGAYINIVPHDYSSEKLAKEPSSTGAFQLAEYIPGERVVLKRNEKYWVKELPYLDEVQMLFIPDPVAQVTALTGGTADLLLQVGIENIPNLEASGAVTVLESRQRIAHFFNMSATQKPFDDLRVRQALKHAIDRPALLKAILQGHGDIGNDQPIAPNSPFWANVPAAPYNVESAKQLLAEAGYADGLEITLVVCDISPRIVDTGVALQEMFKAAGITLTLEKVPVESFWTEKYMQTPFFVSWWPCFSEPDGVLPLAFGSTSFYNESGWGDPQLDELIQQGREERDEAKRKASYAEAQKLISEQGAVLIPYFMPILQAIRTNVKGHIATEVVRPQFIWLAQP